MAKITSAPDERYGTARLDAALLDDLKRVSEVWDVPIRRLLKDAVLLLKATDPRFRFDERAK